MNNVHFAIPEIYGETLSYYELLRKLVDKTNYLIDNYNTVPEQIAEEVKNLDASQLFSTVLNQLIHSIATDNTKSANAVKVYKKHDLLYATFNDTVNLYESLIDFSTGTATELIPGTNIREVNISELFIELRTLIDINKNKIEAVTSVANENSAEITTMHNDITDIENKNTEQDNEISTLRTMISSPYNFKGDVASISALPETGNVNDTYYVQDVKYKVTWTGSAWVQSSLSEADYQTELSELKSDLNNIENVLLVDKTEYIYPSLSWTIGFMGGDGSIYPDSDAVLQYSNKIPVKSGDVLEISADNDGIFRFVTAFNNDTVLIDLATQNVESYTVKDDTNFVVVTTYVIAENKNIVKKYKDYIDVATDVTKLKTDVSKVAPMVTYDDSYLPTEMYFVVNKEYEIYHNQICQNAENYTFKWSYGTNYGNRVRIKYDTVGTRTVTCTIYNANGTQAKILSVNINVVEKVTKDVYLLPFGDSLTNHCMWESELMNMAENIVCVGSRSRITEDSDGENRTVYNEGRAGFTSFDYTNGTSYADSLSDAGGDENPNRWYDPVNKKFSASYYFANNFPSSQHIPTMFTFFLGMNDLLGSNSCTYIAENIKSMIDDIRSYMPDIPIVLIAPQIRYLANLTGDEHLRFLEFSKTLENLSKEYINMVYIPLCYGMDSLNNYSMQDITINTRCDITEKIAKDITHPYKTGYWQIADMVLGAISYLADVN